VSPPPAPSRQPKKPLVDALEPAGWRLPECGQLPDRRAAERDPGLRGDVDGVLFGELADDVAAAVELDDRVVAAAGLPEVAAAATPAPAASPATATAPPTAS
jgi:hypothetical protein